jgi:phosphoglycerate dehydrogenase-like enzyme
MTSEGGSRLIDRRGAAARMGQRNAVRTDSQNPKEEIEIVSLPALPPKIVRRQGQWLRGIRVIQAPEAALDPLLGIFTPEVTWCDARGVHDIPTAEWTVTAILAMQKNLPFFVDRQREGTWTLGQAYQIDHPHPPRSRILRRRCMLVQTP